ncbi:MAG: TMEM175 family protein [Methanosphaera sp.]|uniref:TMEM175 family protein n=1 Tax=Methanosphaera sp. TaxID=2666342 RepID=UPI002E797645|nr:TMEM175 family protein [Methanosphaera sp.]MEE1117302.1 TMEM175 family protein [Methanosphaera sp.]MEE3325135.1 TMEM175 family protein [Methanosphaera sp.]MEE3418232.1 TMEM175 family protein [Methanosphaera sp.]
MESGRFETFIDAIIAIMMTVMVLKIPQPETLTIGGIWDLRIMYLSYIISFIVLFSIWDHHRKLFNIVEDINNRVIWIYSLLIFIITLVPYFTAWVAHEPFSLLPELMFGLIFFLVNIIYVLCTKVAINNDVHNEEVNGISFKELLLINIFLFIIGAVIGIAGYPIALLIMCLLTVITWNVIPYIQNTYVIGDD